MLTSALYNVVLAYNICCIPEILTYLYRLILVRGSLHFAKRSACVTYLIF